MSTPLQERALDMAIEGFGHEEITQRLVEQGHDSAQSMAAAQYALQGVRDKDALPESKPTLDLDAAINKRAVRKTMIMLKVNYKEAGEDAVTDCLTNLQHYCMAKGIDYLACEERAQRHFTAEITGEES